MSNGQKTFTTDELAKYDGTEGRPIYVAHKGVVYDASASKLWRGGKHMNRHKAGHDMELELKEAPHPADVLERLPKVGTLKAAEPDEAPLVRAVPAIVKRFPFLKRHPHPMTVHFPIAFSIAAPVFTVLYLMTGYRGFEYAAFCSLGAGVLMTPVAIVTGLYTWWLNYYSQLIKPVVLKLILTPALMVALVWAFAWRLDEPEILTHIGGDGFFYLALVLSLFPLVSLIGWFGANLTFPPHADE